MPGNKVLTAFTQDGSIVTDKKAYIKHDFLISDQLGWLAPPLQPTRTFGWTKEGSRPRLLGTEYILTSAPASPERNAPLIHTLGKVWEDGLNGIKVKKGNVSDSFKLQLFIATAGVFFCIAMASVWFAISQTYQIPETPAPVSNIIQESTDGILITPK